MAICIAVSWHMFWTLLSVSADKNTHQSHLFFLHLYFSEEIRTGLWRSLQADCSMSKWDLFRDDDALLNWNQFSSKHVANQNFLPIRANLRATPKITAFVSSPWSRLHAKAIAPPMTSSLGTFTPGCFPEEDEDEEEEEEETPLTGSTAALLPSLSSKDLR